MDAFERLEELVSAPLKKKRVLTPEQKARKLERDRKRVLTHEQRARKVENQLKRRTANQEKAREICRKWYSENKEKNKERTIKWRAGNPEKSKEHSRNRGERKTADPEIFAINQTEHYASRGKVVRDITANCPEPTRSQLQALVDRIRADPQAGKAVIGLLRTMRELRKAELAEMQAGLDAG